MPRHRFTDTRDRIEKAAMRLFVAQGVRETSVRDIARAVDISEGALYRHFVSKEQLVWTIFERHYVEFARQLQTLAGREGSARAKVAAMIREFCRAHDENPTLFRFLLFVQHGQLSRLAPETLTPVDVIRNVLGAAIASREIPEQHPDLATAVVFGVVLEPVQFAAYGRLPCEMASFSDRLIAAAWAAVTTV
ncbi:MAG: TetR/AcrR family transcriptional regulator [Acidobacteria bacterium]|nr:MAG: TetR/AcrR family transcriptional regulator [Acidobacteriota bacterium]PYR23541.1 MAG: TetR/AcrR family transcriptional regulator [Acidobacteriota bacterium]